MPTTIIGGTAPHAIHRALANQPIRGFVHAPFDSAECGNSLKKILPVVEIENRIGAARVLRIVIPRRQPHPEIASIAKKTAAKLMQPQIPYRSFGANWLRSDYIIFNFLGSCHQREFQALNRPRTLIADASTAIITIIASELKQRTHHVSRMRPST